MDSNHRLSKQNVGRDCCNESMGYANPADQAACARRYYLANKETMVRRASENNRVKRVRNRAYVESIKLANPTCMDCKLDHPPWRLQFDHRPGEGKIHDVATLVQQAYGLKTIQAEIDNCDLVCANCHTDRTHSRLVAAAGLEPADLLVMSEVL